MKKHNFPELYKLLLITMQLLVFCLSCYFPWRALELTRRGPNSIASVCQHDHPTALDMRLHTIFAMTLTCNAHTHWQYLIWPVPVSLLIYLLVSQRCFFCSVETTTHHFHFSSHSEGLWAAWVCVCAGRESKRAERKGRGLMCTCVCTCVWVCVAIN